MYNPNPKPESNRLESLWSGTFGDDYTERNRLAGEGRDTFWNDLLGRLAAPTILEVGCNLGANLRWLTRFPDKPAVYGIDINRGALARARHEHPRAHTLCSAARRLPFPDSSFSLVFTAGVLIHQPESTLNDVMSEIIRCSERYVLCMEYFSETTTEVFYRDVSGALFKRNYGALYREIHPALNLLEQGFLTPEEGWDNTTFWLFEKPLPQKESASQ